MIIGLDIGNTHIVTGIFDEMGNILLSFRISSRENLTEDEYFSYLQNIAYFRKIKIENINGVIISSVVPTLTNIFVYLARKYFEIEPIIVSSELKLPVKFNIDNPKEVGADRLCNIVQGNKLFPDKKLLIIDFGTATTFDIINNFTYQGGAIFPGIDMVINALFSKTSKLPKVRFSETESVIGKNSIAQINSGIYYGNIGQVKEIINKIEEEIGKCYIITTGGISTDISRKIACIDQNIKELTLNGLFEIFLLNN